MTALRALVIVEFFTWAGRFVALMWRQPTIQVLLSDGSLTAHEIILLGYLLSRLPVGRIVTTKFVWDDRRRLIETLIVLLVL